MATALGSLHIFLFVVFSVKHFDLPTTDSNDTGFTDKAKEFFWLILSLNKTYCLVVNGGAGYSLHMLHI